MGVAMVEVIRYAVVTHAWTERPWRSSAMGRIDVLTIVWSRAPRNMPSSSPERIVRIWRWVYSPVSSGDGAPSTWSLVAIGNHSSAVPHLRRVSPVSATTQGRFSWALVAPVAGLVVLVAAWGRHPANGVAGVLAA